MTTRGIAAAFKDMYDVDISSTSISKVTDGVMEMEAAMNQFALEYDGRFHL